MTPVPPSPSMSANRCPTEAPDGETRTSGFIDSSDQSEQESMHPHLSPPESSVSSVCSRTPRGPKSPKVEGRDNGQATRNPQRVNRFCKGRVQETGVSRRIMFSVVVIIKNCQDFLGLTVCYLLQSSHVRLLKTAYT